MHSPKQMSLFRAALAAFEIRFEDELASRWQNLEGGARKAIVRAPPEEKLSVLSGFFADAARAINGVVHEYFPKLLHVATSQRRHLENDLPLEWTRAQMLRKVCDFLGLDQKFDETSQPRADSRVLDAAVRIALGPGWLDEEIPNDFVFPGWVDSGWRLSQVFIPTSWRRKSDAESLHPLSRADTLLWIKQQEFWIHTRVGRQIEKDSQDAIIAAGTRTDWVPLEQGTSKPRRERSSVDHRKELIARLKARYRNAPAREICELIDQTIEKVAPIRSLNLGPLETWRTQVPGARSWGDLYDHPKTRNRVRSYVNKVPSLKTSK